MYNQSSCLNVSILWNLVSFFPNDKYNLIFLQWRTNLLLLPKFGTNLLIIPIFKPYSFEILLQ